MEGKSAEMSSGFPYLHGYFPLAGNDLRRRLHLLGRQRKTLISAATAREEGPAEGRAILSALSEQ